MAETFVSTISKMGKNGIFIRIPTKKASDFDDWIGADVKVSVEKV